MQEVQREPAIISGLSIYLHFVTRKLRRMLIRPVTQILRTMASSTRDGDIHDGEIRLWQEDDWWIAKDVETGVTTQGESREAALEKLDDAVALHDGDRGRAPTDEELRAAGINPADNTTGDQEPPDVLD
jgi:predicted RNase H-like HicB family nuclease